MLFYISLIIFIIFLLIFIVPMFLVSTMTWLLTFTFDKRRIILHKLTTFWGRIILFAMPAWKIIIEGKDKIDKNKTYMIVANHQSEIDIPLCLMINSHFKFVSKHEVLYIPFFGQMIWFNKYITLKRGFMDSVAKMMKQCENNINDGNSVLLFPEGTRSKDGKIKDFKSGAFILAKSSKIPILPIIIEDSYNALTSKSYNKFKRHKIYLKVLDEISYTEYANLDPTEIANQVKQKVENELALLNSK